ncbi:MAG: hypothetical protein ACJ75B_21885, partial [Flavisolibacter sp.]
MKRDSQKSEKDFFSRPKLIFYFFALVVFGFVVYYFSTIKKDVKLVGKLNFYWLCLTVFAQVLTYFLSAFIYRRLLK